MCRLGPDCGGRKNPCFALGPTIGTNDSTGGRCDRWRQGDMEASDGLANQPRFAARTDKQNRIKVCQFSMSAFAVAFGGKADMGFCTAHVRL